MSTSVIDLIRRVADTAQDPKTLLTSLAAGEGGSGIVVDPQTRQKIQALLDLGLIDELLTIVNVPRLRAKCPIFTCLGGKA